VFLLLKVVLCFRYPFNSSRYFENIGGSGACIYGLIIPMIDARRMEVYSDIYSELKTKEKLGLKL
jgi:hypothetical protein